MAFCIPNVLIQSSLYTIKDYYIDGVLISQDEIVAGASASGQIEGYIFAMLDAFAVGLISFTGQNFGAKKKENMRKCYWYSIAWMMIFWVVCAILCATIPNALLSILLKNLREWLFQVRLQQVVSVYTLWDLLIFLMV